MVGLTNIKYASSKGTIFLASVVTFLAISGCKEEIPEIVSAVSVTEFEERLDNLRKNSNIPGMAAGIVRDGQVTWTKNYGYANVAQQKPVTNTTIFHLASLTKTMASTVIIQLVKENKIELNAPVADYGVTVYAAGTVRVIHLLTHTSEGVPGSYYKYNGDRYALLSDVIKSATGKTFDRLVTERITSLSDYRIQLPAI